MAVKDRDSLYASFVNGAIPSSGDFRNLIDSALNRRDDHFFGEWQKGMKYCNGDVVLFEKALYKLVLTDFRDDCEEDGGETGEGSINEGGTSENGRNDDCYCSLERPDCDKNWCILELELNDSDWEIIEGPDGTVIVVFQLKARIGIGTDTPGARVDITDQETGNIYLEPNTNGKPAVTLLKLNPSSDTQSPEEERKVTFSQAEKTEWETNGLGYAFIRKQASVTPLQSIASRDLSKIPPSKEAPVLMFITSGIGQRPEVGISTDQPEGTFHAEQSNRGKFVVNPGNYPETGILMVNMEKKDEEHYAISGVSQDCVFFSTDLEGGFQFRKGGDISNLDTSKTLALGDTLASISGEGHVGIGIERADSHLEARNSTGAIRLHLGKDNPALGIINVRPQKNYPETYLATGVDDEFATFITNAPSGFAFKKGGPADKNDNSVNINQGDHAAFLTKEGKLGIKTSNPPEDYEVDVFGQIRTLTLFLETDGNKIEVIRPLLDEDAASYEEDKKNFLECFDNLRPLVFKWKDQTQLNDEGEQFGFNAQNVFESFAPLVKKSGSNKAVAYANMNAVLVQMLKLQQAQIKALDERVCALEEQLGIQD